MNFLPVCLNVDNSRVVVAGGGNIAEQKLRTLLKYTRNIICAPDIAPAVRSLEMEFHQKPYEQAILDGAGELRQPPRLQPLVFFINSAQGLELGRFSIGPWHGPQLLGRE